MKTLVKSLSLFVSLTAAIQAAESVPWGQGQVTEADYKPNKVVY